MTADEEKNTGKAIEIRNRFVDGEILIVCPDLLIYEVSNALRYVKTLGEKDVKEAVELAMKHGTTVYDAVYVALRRATGLHAGNC